MRPSLRSSPFPPISVEPGLWRNTVETDGDKGAGLPSDTLKLLLQAYRWIIDSRDEDTGGRCA